MTATLFTSPPRATDSNGDPISGALLYFYAEGTTTPQPVYTTAALSVEHTNPVVADSAGLYPAIYLDDSLAYKVVEKTATGVTVKEYPTLSNGGATALRSDLASTATGKGAALVAYIASGAGAVARTILAWLRDYPNVKDYGATGDGSTDDAAAIRAAITANAGKRIYFPKPSVAYLVESAIGELPEGTRLVGESKRNTKIVRGYSDTDYLITMGESTGLEHLWIDGDGATYTGGGVQVKLGTGRQHAAHCRIINFAGGIPLHFPCTGALSTEAAGSQSDWNNIEAYRVDSTAGSGRHAIVHDDPSVASAGHPIVFRHLETSGYESIDFGACNNFFVTDSSLFGMKFSTYGVSMSIVGGRVSQGNGGSETITLKGSGDFNGVHCYLPLETDSTAGNSWTITGGWQNSGFTDNNPNSTTVIYERRLISYTPEFTANGVAITLGNGSVLGQWYRQGFFAIFHVRLIVGSTTSIGAGAIKVSLPTKCNGNIPNQCMVHGHLSSGGAVYKFSGRIVSGEVVARLERDTSGAITNTSPSTIASGDQMYISGMYAI